MRRLERELGHELFDRSARTVRLTAVGAAVLPHARTAVAAVAGLRTAVDELTGLLGGRLAVGSLVACAVGLPDLLAGFHRAHPDVGTGLRTCLDEACTAAGFRPSIAFEAGDPNVLADLAARGLGPAVLPESLARGRTDLHSVAIQPQLRGRVALAWRADGPSSPAARAFLAAARAALVDAE